MGQKSYPCRRDAAGIGSLFVPLGRWNTLLRHAASVAAVLALALVCYGGLGAKPALAQSGPSGGGSFCQQDDVENCQGPTTAPDQDISSSAQRQIEQRIQEIRCQNSSDPACVTQGTASEDSASLNGFSWFFSGEYQHKDRTQTTNQLGFDSDTAGGTAGIDYRLGTSGVIGGAFNYRHDFGDYKHSYGNFDQDTENLIIYGSYFPSDQSFIDLSFGFANKDFTNTHIDTGGGTGSVSGDTNGFEFTGDLSGGYDFSFDAFTVGPRAGLHYKRTEFDAFSERSADPAAITDSYLDQLNESLTGTLGAQASYAISTDFGVVVPQVNAEYVHEFLGRQNNQVILGCCGGGVTTFTGDNPDRNYFNVGAGVVFVLPNGVSPFVNFQAELGNSLEETESLTAGVRVEM
jgi:uncharacterized protein YhjY with autotransporter beta-barrel domain